MLSILLVAVIGGGFVSRGFVLFKRLGRPEYAGKEKEIINQLLITAAIFFTVAFVVSLALKYLEFEQ